MVTTAKVWHVTLWISKELVATVLQLLYYPQSYQHPSLMKSSYKLLPFFSVWPKDENEVHSSFLSCTVADIKIDMRGPSTKCSLQVCYSPRMIRRLDLANHCWQITAGESLPVLPLWICAFLIVIAKETPDSLLTDSFCRTRQEPKSIWYSSFFAGKRGNRVTE